MSTGSQSQGGTRSVAGLRNLLGNNLLERAVAASEVRWPGSGPMVRLAHEWAELPAPARRQRMAEIGPEELAKFRFLGSLNPELGTVLDDLESRGIIPPAVTEPPPPADAVAAEQDALLAEAAKPSFEEAVIDAAVDYAAAGAAAGVAGAAGATVGAMTARERMAALQVEAGERSTARARAMAEGQAARAGSAAGMGASAMPMSPALGDLPAGAQGDAAVAAALKQRPAAHINLHKENQERMQVALEQATSILDRVRSTVDKHARLPMTASWPTVEQTQLPPQPQPFAPTPVTPRSATAHYDRAITPERTREALRAFEMTEPTRRRDGVIDEVHDDTTADEITRRLDTMRGAADWVTRLRTSEAVVVTVGEGASAPTTAMLTQMGQALRLPVVELDGGRQTRHDLWGGLRREGREAVAFAGALPVALAQGSLVVLRGSLTLAHQQRFAEGFIDIPGTRASMRVHQESRVLLVR